MTQNEKTDKTNENKGPGRRLILFLLTANLLLSGGIIGYLAVSARTGQGVSLSGYDQQEYGKYVLYIGTNDKDTYTQLISLDDAKDTVNAICAKYVSGYTVQEANGGWVDEKGNLTEEQTLVYSFSGADEEAITSIMDEVLIALNQNSILVERQDLTYTYYSGKK